MVGSDKSAVSFKYREPFHESIKKQITIFYWIFQITIVDGSFVFVYNTKFTYYFLENTVIDCS